MTPEEIAWLGGLFDGEGHISVLTKLSQRCKGVKIQITNTNRDMLDVVKTRTGIGYITERPVMSTDRPTWKIRYDWHTTGGNAKELLSMMLPWLIEKREAAIRAIGTQQAITG